MIEDGNGHGCEAKYLTRPQAMPTSSSTSRRTASSIVSPGSAKPARHDHMVGAKRRERPSTQRSPAIASMMTTGSVRGKCSRLQTGQSRRQPACTTLRRRAAIRTEAMARMPAEQRLGFGKRRQMLRRRPDPAPRSLRRSVIFRSLRALSGSIACGSRPKPKRGASSIRPRNTFSRAAAERARLGGREQRIAVVAGALQHHEFAADHIDAGARDLRESFLSAASSSRSAAARSSGLAM